ncbi:MAG: hypothetical protein ACTTJH_07230 [Bacteroidales bacterium]
MWNDIFATTKILELDFCKNIYEFIEDWDENFLGQMSLRKTGKLLMGLY